MQDAKQQDEEPKTDGRLPPGRPLWSLPPTWRPQGWADRGGASRGGSTTFSHTECFSKIDCVGCRHDGRTGSGGGCHDKGRTPVAPGASASRQRAAARGEQWTHCTTDAAVSSTGGLSQSAQFPQLPGLHPGITGFQCPASVAEGIHPADAVALGVESQNRDRDRPQAAHVYGAKLGSEKTGPYCSDMVSYYKSRPVPQRRLRASTRKPK